MTDMKCPVCLTELETMAGLSESVLGCPKYRHIATIGVWGNWINSIQVLNVATDALKDICTVYAGDIITKASTLFGRATSAINQINQIIGDK